MQARNKKLVAAHETHKFNRDSKEVYAFWVTALCLCGGDS